MSAVPVRDLRNHTAEVIDRARRGEDVTITSHGVPVARLVPVGPGKRASIPKPELLRSRAATSDPTLARDLAALAGEFTDELEPAEW